MKLLRLWRLATNPPIFLQRETVGHAGDVIADGAVEADLFQAALGTFAHKARVGGVGAEQFAHGGDSALVRLVGHGVEVKILVEKIAQLLIRFP